MANIQSGINKIINTISGGVFLIKKREEALKKAEEKFRAKQIQKKKRRNFLDYIKNDPTNLGGNVGNLSPKLQKQIAKSYTTYERKKIMDLADKKESNK